MKILAVESHKKSIDGTNRTSAVDWWRTIAPMKAVAKQTGWDIDYQSDITDFSALSKYDLVWTSYFNNILGFQELIKSKVPFVIDFDDDFLHLSQGNPVRREYAKNSLAYKSIEFMIKHAPHITTSTAHLSKVYEKVRSSIHEHPPMVLENRITSEQYLHAVQKVKKDGIIRIGWMGGATHYNDIFHTPFWGALTYLQGKYKDVGFSVMGLYEDADYSSLPNFSWVDGSIDHPTFTKNLAEWSQGVDIFVAPLENTLFNDSKSSIKVQECGIYGKPVVASNVRPYQEFNADSNGLIDLCETHSEWVHALEDLIVDRKKRETKGKLLSQFIQKEYSIDSVVDNYIDFINFVTKNADFPRYEQREMLKNGSLNIVLACRRFETTTGSELYYYELAREFLHMGHHVTIVAENVGDPLTRKIIGLGGEVINLSDANTLQPDLIIASHEPVPVLLEMYTAPLIQVVHSENDYLWEIEKPIHGCHAYVGVRDSITERIIKEGIHPEKVHTIWNPIDLSRFTPSNESDKTLLFVGPQDKLRKKVIKHVEKIARKKGLKPVFVGQHQDYQPTWDIEEYVKKCEMTASVYMGRTTLEGWACGKSGLICEIDGEGNILSKRIVAPQDTDLFDSKKVSERMLALC